MILVWCTLPMTAMYCIVLYYYSNCICICRLRYQEQLLVPVVCALLSCYHCTL